MGTRIESDSVSEKRQANADVIRAFALAYNEQRKGWFEDFHGRDYVWEGLGAWAPAGQRLSYDQMLAMIDEEVRRFPDRRMEIHQLVVDGDQAAVDYEWSGTAAFDMPPLRKGEVQRWRNLLFVSFRGGVMVRAREYGVAPPEAQ